MSVNISQRFSASSYSTGYGDLAWGVRPEAKSAAAGTATLAGVAERGEVLDPNAGLKAGDVITKIDDHLITSSDGLVAIIRSYRPGESVTVTYERGGDTHTVRATLDSDATTQNS